MFRDPPHYLKPLRSTTVPKRLMFLAAKGHTSKRRDHYETHFLAAALGRTWWTARTNTRKDAIAFYDSPADIWADVTSWCPQGRRVVLFTYDLAEQMRLAQMLTHLPGSGWDLDKIVLERTASWCLLRNGKRSLMCCDLMSWCPVSFEKLASDVAPGGIAGVVVEAGPHYPKLVAQYRVGVIREATLQILRWIEDEGNGPFRPTGSGQSFGAYRRRFIRTRLLVHDEIGRLGAERGAMHTGRAEAWRHGPLRSGPFVEYDLHAAYATIGRDCAIPTIARGSFSGRRVSLLERYLDRYAVLADLTVETDIECVPCTLNNRTLWPVGRFRTFLWDPEIKLALTYCKSVRVNQVWLYSRDYALSDFCAYVLDGIDANTLGHSPIARRVLKHWSRCLVGRMGLRYRIWHRFGEQEPPDVFLTDYWDMVDGTKTEMLAAGRTRFVLGEMTEARESLPQIPGWIMSECRRKLWETMRIVGEDLVYVDTDSIILRGHGDNRLPMLYDNFTERRGWALKGTYPTMTIHGPRNLEIGSERRVSGLPLNARQTAPLEFDGEVMRSVKRSMRNGELDLVVSLPRKFYLTAPDLRREHLPDGSTAPYRLEESCL